MKIRHEGVPKVKVERKENFFKRYAAAGLVSGLLLLNGCASTQVQQTRQAETEYQRRDADLVRHFPSRGSDPRRTTIGGVTAYEITLTRPIGELSQLATTHNERVENGVYRISAAIENMAYAEFRMENGRSTFSLFYMREASDRTPGNPVHTCTVASVDNLARIFRDEYLEDFTRATIVFEATTGSVAAGRRQLMINAYLVPLTADGSALVVQGGGILVARAEFNHAFRSSGCVESLAILREPRERPSVAAGARSPDAVEHGVRSVHQAGFTNEDVRDAFGAFRQSDTATRAAR